MYDSENTNKTYESGMSDVDAFRKTDSGEDLLLVQIDAFRDKALKLQSLINAREKRVKELEALVRTKEAKNQELQNTLIRKQREADSLVSDVNVKVDDLISEVRVAMADMQQKLENQVGDSEEASQKHSMAVQDTLSSMNEGLTQLKNEISEKVHSENVKVYRNISDLLNEKSLENENQEVTHRNFKGVKAQNVFLIFLSFLNLGAIVVSILLQLGLI